MALEATTIADLYALFKYWKKGARLIKAMCRSGAINIGHEKDGAFFQTVGALILRPDRFINPELAFHSHKLIGTPELRRWLQK